MSESYQGTSYDDLNPTTPVDTDFVGTAAAAIRQIKGFLKDDTLGGFFDTIFRRLYPVGSYFITESDESPANRFGGTWELVSDKFLIGAGNLYPVGSEGGEVNHTLTVDEMPWHDHGAGDDTFVCGGYGWNNLEHYNEFPVKGKKLTGQGGNQPHNNMPPYRAVYIWKKVAD